MNYAIDVRKKNNRMVSDDCPIIMHNECIDQKGRLCEWNRGIISDNKILCGFFHIDIDGDPIISSVKTFATLSVKKGDVK